MSALAVYPEGRSKAHDGVSLRCLWRGGSAPDTSGLGVAQPFGPTEKVRPLEEHRRSNIQYFPQIQQALAAGPEIPSGKGGNRPARSAARERRKVALSFLSALDEEFSRLLRLARIISSLSPEVAPIQEFERVRLTLAFRYRLQALRVELALGGGGHATIASGERYREPAKRAHGNGDEGTWRARGVSGGDGVSD